MVFSLFLTTHLDASQVSDSAVRGRLAGVMAIWLVPLPALRFIVRPLSDTFFLVQKRKVGLICQSALLGMVVMIPYGFDSYSAALIVNCAAYVEIYLLYLMLFRQYACRSVARV